MASSGRVEIQRLEYDGYALVKTRLPSALSHGPPTFERWEISRINANGSLTLIGYENSEEFAKLVVDYRNGRVPN